LWPGDYGRKEKGEAEVDMEEEEGALTHYTPNIEINRPLEVVFADVPRVCSVLGHKKDTLCVFAGLN